MTRTEAIRKLAMLTGHGNEEAIYRYLYRNAMVSDLSTQLSECATEDLISAVGKLERQTL